MALAQVDKRARARERKGEDGREEWEPPDNQIPTYVVVLALHPPPWSLLSRSATGHQASGG
jgi:hypothetical protein